MATERTVLVRMKADPSDFNRAMLSAKASLRGLRDEIDTTNDRTAWLAQSILGLGPTLVPIGAVAVPALAALATQMLVAGVAAGSMGLAFNGIGDGLKALNEYQLAPTQENFAKLDEAMRKLGPDGQHFVEVLDQAADQLKDLQMVARAGMFPGMEDGIAHLLTLLPQVKRIVGDVSEGIGELSSDAGKGLAGDKFSAFFDYLETDARPILMDMGHTVGFLTEGFANLLVKFGPLTRVFSDGMAGMAENFAVWSRSLDSNDSFQAFLDYIIESGPRVVDFLGSLVHAFAAIVEAAAPVGAALLPLFSGLLDAIANLADTPLGPIFLTAAAAMSIYGRAVALGSVTTRGLVKTIAATTVTNARAAVGFEGLGTAISTYARNALTAGAASQRMSAGSAAAATRIASQGRAFAATAGQVGLLAFSASGMADKMGVANTATYALLGSMAAPGFGTAIGALIGGFLDLRAAGSGVTDTLDQLQRAIDSSNADQLILTIEQAKKELSDLRDNSGFGDVVSDDLKRTWGLLSGKGFNLNTTLKDSIDQGQGALDKIDAAAATRNLDQLGGAARTTGAGMRYAGMSVADFTAHINALNAVLEDRASMRDYQASLDDFRKGLKKGDHAWDIHYAKGRQNQALLDNIAATAIRMTKNMSQADKIKTLSRARGDFIKAAEAAGIAHAQAVRLANRLLGMNAIRSNPKVELKGAPAAISAANAITRAVNAIPGFHLITIEERRRYTNNNGPGSAGQVRTPAAGGKMRAMFPGETTGPTDDTIPAMVSHDEWVIRAASARRYGDAFMAAVNAGTYRPIGYAAGGSPSMSKVSVSAAPVNIGDTVVRVLIDGKELDARVELLMDQRDDVAGSYDRAVRTAD